MAILGGIVYSLLIPKVSSGGSGQRARPTAAMADINGCIKAALDQYKIDTGAFPKSLQNLVVRPEQATNWHEPYLEKLPIDPWGNPYYYVCPGPHNTSSYDLFSSGPDQRIGTEDDLCNWTQ